MKRKIVNMSTEYNELYLSVRDYGQYQESKLFKDKQAAHNFITIDLVKEEDSFQVNIGVVP